MHIHVFAKLDKSIIFYHRTAPTNTTPVPPFFGPFCLLLCCFFDVPGRWALNFFAPWAIFSYGSQQFLLLFDNLTFNSLLPPSVPGEYSETKGAPVILLWALPSINRWADSCQILSSDSHLIFKHFFEGACLNDSQHSPDQMNKSLFHSFICWSSFICSSVELCAGDRGCVQKSLLIFYIVW